MGDGGGGGGTSVLLHTLAGALGGSIASAILNPLEVVRIRLQSAESAITRPRPTRLVMDILRNEGPLAFYRGLLTSIIGVGPARALYFGGLRVVKQELGPGGRRRDRPVLTGVPLDIVAATVSGIFSNTIMSPWWVIRTRLQLQHDPVIFPAWLKPSGWWSGSVGFFGGFMGGKLPPPPPVLGSAAVSTRADVGYRGVLDCASRMYREEGWLSFYRGLSASYLGVIETALNFALYSYLKSYAARYRLSRASSVDHAGLSPPLLDSSLPRKASSASPSSSSTASASSFSSPSPSPHSSPRTQQASPPLYFSLLLDSSFTIGAVSKLIASVITYPHEVIRTRMREQRSHVASPLILASDGAGAAAAAATTAAAKALSSAASPSTARGSSAQLHALAIDSSKYKSILQTIRLILAEEGLRGLYGGMSVHLIRTVPNTAIILWVVETLVGGDL
jgi:solute carrier family 25 protein 33/36